jgi:hypothetical protein
MRKSWPTSEGLKSRQSKAHAWWQTLRFVVTEGVDTRTNGDPVGAEDVMVKMADIGILEVVALSGRSWHGNVLFRPRSSRFSRSIYAACRPFPEEHLHAGRTGLSIVLRMLVKSKYPKYIRRGDLPVRGVRDRGNGAQMASGALHTHGDAGSTLSHDSDELLNFAAWVTVAYFL